MDLLGSESNAQLGLRNVFLHPVEDTSQLEPAVMFGMFTWDFSSDQENNREFDINIKSLG